jgi:hypothetical protein
MLWSMLTCTPNIAARCEHNLICDDKFIYFIYLKIVTILCSQSLKIKNRGFKELSFKIKNMFAPTGANNIKSVIVIMCNSVIV